MTQFTLPHVEPHLSSADVAELLGVHPVTVRRWRVRNKEAGHIKEGPPYEYRGRTIVYPTQAFKEWCARTTVVGGVVRANAPPSVVPELAPEPAAQPAPTPSAIELEIQQALDV